MYNLTKRQAEVEILPMAAAEKLAVVCYGPTGGGLLTGKYGSGKRPASGRLVENKMYATRYSGESYYEVAERFTLLAGERGQPHDLLRDGSLLLEGEADRAGGVREIALRLGDGGDLHLLPRVEEVLHEHHRVVSLFEGLAVEVRRQLLKGLRVEVDGDRHVLVRGGELVRDLLVQCADEAAP